MANFNNSHRKSSKNISGSTYYFTATHCYHNIHITLDSVINVSMKECGLSCLAHFSLRRPSHASSAASAAPPLDSPDRGRSWRRPPRNTSRLRQEIFSIRCPIGTAPVRSQRGASAGYPNLGGRHPFSSTQISSPERES